MKKSFFASFVTLFFSWGCTSFSALQAQSAADVFYPGRLWVQMNPEVSAGIPHRDREVNVGDFEKIIGEQLSGTMGINEVRKPFHFAKSKDISEVFEIRFSTPHDETYLIGLLEKLPFVNYAERVPVMRPTLTPNDLGPESGTNNQWGLWKISAQAAWDISTGNEVVKVAVVDDAVLVTHPDLIPNLVAGYDVADDDTDPMPNNNQMSHGTHVAGIIGAATNNATGVASIGFSIKLLPVKSSNQAQIVTDGYTGVVWAADNGADVINMSWGGTGFSQTGQNIMNYAYNAKCINVAAAGNDNVNTIFYPAGYANVISVASTNTTDAKSSFSNYGTWVDVSSPGSEIRSTYFNASFAGTYANLSGTSMASPMVAGLAGLVLSVNPEMSQVQATDCILNTTDNIDSFNGGFIGQLGSGRINAHEAVLCALATVNAPPVPIVQALNPLVCPGEPVQFVGNSLGGTATSFQWSFPGGNPSSSTEQNPLVTYSGMGLFNVSLTTSNDWGSSVVTEAEFVEVSTAATELFYSQNFETGTLAQMGYQIQNPDNGITWEVVTVGGSTSGTKAARVNLFSYPSNAQRDGMVSPTIDFSGYSNVKLDFKHAHRRRSASFSDSLIIYVSLDGGATFPHKVFAAAETGQGTFATNSILNQNFVPANGNDWCFGGDIGSGCFTVDLSDFDGEPSVRIKFETYNNTGNNIYVDDIEISGSCYLPPVAPVANFSSLGTQTCAGGTIQFFDQSQNVPSGYSWIFEGGNPGVSNSPAPLVFYDQPGTYAVTLAVTNAYGTDEIVQSGYITVTDGFELNVAESVVQACQNVPFELSASGADSYTWSPSIGLSATTGSNVTASPNFDVTYTVTGSVGNCTLQSTVEVIVGQGPITPIVVSQNNVSFTVMNPSNVQGHFEFTSPAAGWGGPALTAIALDAFLVIARDANAADSLLCGAAVNGAEIEGKIAVVYRGTCEFSAKALNAQNAGAVAVIVVNNVPDAPVQMAAGASGALVTIPVFMVSQSVGAYLNEAINSGQAQARIGQFNGGDLVICPGQEIQLAAPGGESQYLWTDGSTNAVINITEPGTYAVSVFGENGCPSASINYEVTYFVSFLPIIQQNGNLLSAPNIAGTDHQWFLNGVPIPGANSSVLIITESGNYQVQMTHSSGCILMSDVFLGTYVGVGESQLPADILIYPVPAREYLEVRLPGGISFLSAAVYSLDGKMTFSLPVNADNSNGFKWNISPLSAGVYVLGAMTNTGPVQLRFIKVD